MSVLGGSVLGTFPYSVKTVTINSEELLTGMLPIRKMRLLVPITFSFTSMMRLLAHASLPRQS